MPYVCHTAFEQCRKWHMATIRKRPGPHGKNVWQVQIIRHGYSRRYRTFDTKGQAQDWAREIERAMARGTVLPSREEERITLADALNRYVQEVTIHKLGAAQEERRARQIAGSYLDPIFLGVIGGKEIANYRDRRVAAGKSPNTVRLELALLSHLYTVARTEWGMTTLVNPVEYVKKPKLPAGRSRRLESKEEGKLLKAAREYGGDIESIIRFALETGMRRSEIVELLWTRINFAKRILTIPEAKDAKVIRSREVPLSSGACSILKKLPRRLDGRVWDITQNGVSQAFSRVCKRAGISDLRFHDLRHEAISRFFERGLNPMQVAAISGHRTLQMLKRYTHLRAADLAKLLG